MWLWFDGSGPRAEMALISSERTSTTMGITVEFNLIHGFHGEIWGSKLGPGKRSGGCSPETPKGRLASGPGGECFAPFLSEASSSSHIGFLGLGLLSSLAQLYLLMPV